MTAGGTLARKVEERLRPGDVPLWVNPEWDDRFPWLVQGTTGRGAGEEPFDLGLSGAQPVGTVMERWRELIGALRMAGAVHSRQVHGAEIRTHADAVPGILVMSHYDGHATDQPGLLLTVSVADCTPVSIVDPEGRSVALVHAGWRGTAAGIVEGAIDLLADRWGAQRDALWLHCGPSICGSCYEVGPEVHEAVNPALPVPQQKTPVDVAAAIVRRATRAGLDPDRVTWSGHCTRCGPPDFFSHRAGSPGRQMGVLGIRG